MDRRRYIAVTRPESSDACSETSEQRLPIDTFDLEDAVSSVMAERARKERVILIPE